MNSRNCKARNYQRQFKRLVRKESTREECSINMHDSPKNIHGILGMSKHHQSLNEEGRRSPRNKVHRHVWLTYHSTCDSFAKENTHRCTHTNTQRKETDLICHLSHPCSGMNLEILLYLAENHKTQVETHWILVMQQIFQEEERIKTHRITQCFVRRVVQ